MTNHIEHVPGVNTFVSAGPHVRQIAQKCIECSRSPAEDGNRVREVLFRRVLVCRRFCFHKPDSIRLESWGLSRFHVDLKDAWTLMGIAWRTCSPMSDIAT